MRLLRTSEPLMTNGQMKELRVSTTYQSELFIMAEPPNLVNYLLPDKRFSTHAYERAKEVSIIVSKEDSHAERETISIVIHVESPIFIGRVIKPSKENAGNLVSQLRSVAQLFLKA